MGKYFHVNILTPAGKIFEGDVAALIVPAALGYLGVLADHAPLVANLTAGKIIFRDKLGSQTVIYNKGKGFLEVVKNKAAILLDSA